MRVRTATTQSELDLSTVPATVADALIATVRGVDRAEKRDSGLLRLAEGEKLAAESSNC